MQANYRSPKLQALWANGKLKQFSRDEMVGSTASPTINLVVKGYIKRYMITNRGSLGVQIVYGPQDVFSLTHIYPLLLGQCLHESAEEYYYQAMCRTEILCLSPEQLCGGVQTDPLLYKELFAEAGYHLKSCVHTIENKTLDNLYKRVAHLLVFLAQEHGQTVADGIKILVPIRHQDLADLLESTRESVTRALGALRANGLIANGKGIVIFDLERLSKEAYS